MPDDVGVLSRAWRVSPQVSLRPEPFGALAYHFGTRRLSFLKSRTLLQVVETLERHPTAADACRAAGVTEGQMPSYEQALETLATTGMIEVSQVARVEQGDEICEAAP